MSDRIILNANLGRTNVAEFDDFGKITIDTLNEIIKLIIPLCGVNALHDLVIYKGMANDFMSNVFSNDGIHILKNIEYMSPIQTYIANYIRYIAERVERAAADGTSTAIYLASSLIIETLKDVQDIRDDKYKSSHDQIDIYRRLMEDTLDISDGVVKVLTMMMETIKKFRISLKDADVETKRALIYQLAYTTSKRNETLTKYAVDLFIDLPEILYEYSHYNQSKIETDEDLTVENPDYDMIMSVLPSNNVQFNSKLGTELLYEKCDLLVCPYLLGTADILAELLKQRTQQNKDDAAIKGRKNALKKRRNPLVIIYTGANDNDVVRLELASDSSVTLCRLTAYHPMFVNNPLELNILQAVGGISPFVQKDINEFRTSIITDVKCRLYGKDLYIYNLFSHDTTPLHPDYVSGNNPGYDKLRRELEERILSLKNSHNKKDIALELNEFVRLYRNLICSRLPILTIGGSTVDHLANVNVVNDVLGVVSVAMKNGVILDLMPKFEYALGLVEGISTSDWLIRFRKSVNDFCRLTYRLDDVCNYLKEAGLNTTEMRDYVCRYGNWVKFDHKDECKSVVVQSYRAITETLTRLIETVPRIICTDRIIVPDSVMGDKKE